ncbi:sugar ABC transporter substrate-binding protein [Clostridium polyendosporum]|uniref:Sugar ABC transporter substrate-binding protein n=1 Tax=Clostridium polyendosporum TaxID=69208 RepID=A0A919VF25_9CLOT|nr:sugar ABC transporter substrate-binding protein [Clostridium polyendosporum]GIM29804.1 sugar ABC transporter substrate-binding protein [Clostridium polyendosporum]
MGKRLLTLTLAISMSLLVGLTGCSKDSSSTASTSGKKVEYSKNIPEKISKKSDKVKVMVIRKIGGDDHTAQYLAGAKNEGESLGFKVDTFTANGDTAKFHDAINQAIEKNYDGVIISHGDDAATVDDVKKLTDKGIPVVTFDSNSDISKIKGVTITSQNDESLAKLSLEELKKVTLGQAKMAYLWVDGFPPMVSRNKVYQQLLKDNPGIKEIDRFGVATADTSVQTQNAVSAMLTKYPKGQLDTIFATWDAFAIGAARAIKEAGRTDVKLVSIDVSNADLQAIQEEGSPWIGTAACDPKLIGAVDLRILAKKIAGEETPETYKFEATLITQEQLKSSGKPVNMDNLSEIVQGWGKSDAFQEPWMTELKGIFKK